MATLQLFTRTPRDFANGMHDTDGGAVYKIAFYSSAAAFAPGDAAPVYSAVNEVTGGQIPVGGVTMANATASDTNFDFDDFVIAADAANPANVRFLLLYNDTDPSDAALAFADYATDQDLTPGGTIRPDAAGATGFAIV